MFILIASVILFLFSNNLIQDAFAVSTTAQTTIIASPPAAPTITSVSQTSSGGSMSIAFTPPIDNGGATISSYIVKYALHGSDLFTTVTGFSTSSPITVTGLTAATNYDFEIAAVNSAGSGTPTGITSGTTIAATAPTAPTITSAYQTSSTSIAIAFTSPTDNGGATISSYTVKYALHGSGSFTTVTGLGISSPITVTGLTAATNYDFEIAAVNSAGTGTFSSVSVSATPAATSGNTVTSTAGDLTFAPSTTGMVSLSSGTSTVVLSDNTALNFANSLSTASGGSIVVGGGAPIVLNSYTSGTLSGVDLSVPQNIGGQSVTVNQAVQINSGQSGTPVTITNAAIPNISASIPDGTAVLAPSGWDGKITPPKIGSSSGTAPSGFSVGGTVIEVGSPDVVLLFDKPATLLLSGVKGNVGYKPAGSDTWVQITNACGGTYASPSNPVFPSECFISNGADTKIVTYHFTTFGGFNSNSGSIGGSPGGSTIPPSVTSSAISSPTSGIFGGKLVLNPQAPPPSTALFETGDPIDVQLSFFDYRGPSTMQHIALYTNLNGVPRNIDDSDTWVIYERGSPIEVHDPNKFWKSANVTTFIDGNNLNVTFTITFAKPMVTSDIIIRAWDQNLNSWDTRYTDAIEVMKNQNAIVPYVITPQNNNVPSNSLKNTNSQNSTNTDLLSDIKKWGGYSSESISDSELLKIVGIDAQHIPSWFMKTSKWVISEDVTPQEFTSALKYMYEKGIIK